MICSRNLNSRYYPNDPFGDWPEKFPQNELMIDADSDAGEADAEIRLALSKV